MGKVGHLISSVFSAKEVRRRGISSYVSATKLLQLPLRLRSLYYGTLLNWPIAGRCQI